MSLNIWGIHTFEKHRSIFIWLMYQNSDICFLQETSSTGEIENQCRKQWLGDIYFAHGSTHSCGVAILIRKSFDFNLKSFQFDKEGWYIILEASIQGSPLILVNIYAPNTTAKQSLFFKSISELIDDEQYQESNHQSLFGGDLSVTLEPDLDCSGGNPMIKDSVKFVENNSGHVENSKS